MAEHHPDDAPRREREREVIVTDGGRGNGMSTVVAAVIGIILVLLVGWFLFNVVGGADSGDSGGAEIDVPSEVNVDVDDGAGGGEGDGG